MQFDIVFFSILFLLGNLVATSFCMRLEVV